MLRGERKRIAKVVKASRRIVGWLRRDPIQGGMVQNPLENNQWVSGGTAIILIIIHRSVGLMSGITFEEVLDKSAKPFEFLFGIFGAIWESDYNYTRMVISGAWRLITLPFALASAFLRSVFR
jgi:hypothetical protein